ncbi:DUF6559 family protein [Thalassotalea marina]|uniref:Uncharacterized protein n=1 Tax=Thalassotalea marina TaxID=1673741 RepID=A0A919EPA7_9GAMM|nr:DUF6559 family protein [Thalassotalea marina]GHG02770.1 hypothetical protein GCM10017161_34670 [Thalassotalea marina]
MFKYWSIKKYGSKLLPQLEKHYGENTFYTASQIRTIVYKKDFNPSYLPLGYILFLDPARLDGVLAKEFPEVKVNEYKKEILTFLEEKSYNGFLLTLQ